MISVIIISHNYGKYLQDCINSVLNNDPELIKEIILLNDASSDNTDEVSKKNLRNNKKIKYFSQNFFSLPKSINFSIKNSSSPWITKIDADDLIEPFFLKKFFNYANQNNLDYVYGNLLIKDEVKNISFTKIQEIHGIKKYFNYPVGSGNIFKKKIWEDVGGFNENIYYQDDYDFWLKIIKNKNFKIGYLNEAGYIYRKHKKNMSKNKIKKNLTKIKVFFSNTLFDKNTKTR